MDKNKNAIACTENRHSSTANKVKVKSSSLVNMTSKVFIQQKMNETSKVIDHIGKFKDIIGSARTEKEKAWTAKS